MKSFGAIFAQEARSPTPIMSTFIIDDYATALVQEHGLTLDDLAFDSEWIENDEKARAAFLNGCNEFAERVKVSHPARTGTEFRSQLSSPDMLRSLVTHSDLIAGLLKSKVPYNSTEYQDQLRVFPDLLAIGRWHRIMLWYVYQYTLGNLKDFDTNWHDANYAFASSYTGMLGTDDGGLINLVKVLFPHVVVRSSTT